MKFYKIIIFLYISFFAIGCESVPKNIHSFSSTLNEVIKTLNTTLNNSSSNSTALGKTKSPKGMLTSDQCQNSQDKTKLEIEIMTNEKLTDRRADSLNSLAVTYNFQISDRLSMYGVNSDSKVICSLTFNENKSFSKVVY
ncbi:hypothetical protein GUK58_05525 [Acinetobacter pittii]|uniref:hypothetical protein n=1 Tax=Acinetobacter pittii TaxID=48296 RepID=UPI00136DF342|nr:hypothetical protein [Acinetobacter pittii]MCU4548653.1 hypothetical protein [Acinetobacter pittii]MZY05508.1 hypothetical protein [Acinetobacter pittii]